MVATVAPGYAQMPVASARPVPRGTTLEEARDMMSGAANQQIQARLAPRPALSSQVSSNP
jgi:hypothetical protein